MEIDTKIVGGFFGNSLPKNYFSTVLAVFITVVKCTYFPSLEICDVRYLENGITQNNWKSYYKGERAKYFCNTNYHTDNEDGEIMCTKSGWSPTPRCIHKGECAYFCPDPGMSHPFHFLVSLRCCLDGSETLVLYFYGN